ncbi:MAG: MFS transporter [Candidatus Bathyarchaeota archaeon]
MVNRKALIVYLSVLLDPLIVTSYNPLVPVLKTAFNVNIELISLSLTFHMLPFSLLNLFSGTLSDLYERPKIFMYGLFVTCFGSLLGAISPDISIFLISRVFQGVGSALIMPLSLAIIADIIPRKEMGKAMGQYGVFIGVGSTVGPLMAGYLSLLEWRIVPFAIFAYSLCMGIILKMVFDIRGLRISRDEEKRLNLKQFRQVALNRNLLLVSLGAFIFFFSFQGIQSLISDSLFFEPLFLEKSGIGVVFGLIGVVGIALSYIGGLVIDRIGEKKTILLTFLASTVPFFLLTLTSAYLPYLCLLLLGSGLNRIGFSALQALAVILTPETRGTASSIFNFVRYLGFGLAPMIMAPIYKVQGISTVYILNSVLLFFGFLLSNFVRLEILKKGVEKEKST